MTGGSVRIWREGLGVGGAAVGVSLTVHFIGGIPLPLFALISDLETINTI